MRYPNTVNAYRIAAGEYNNTQAGVPGQGFAPARPMGFASIQSRVKAAWLVFTGRADALIWPGQED